MARGMIMRATRLYGIGDLRQVTVDRPLPGPGEVVVKVEAAGICGTDRHLFKGEFPSAPPVTLGHEFSGIITSVGESVTLPIGARITCDPNCPCGTCPECRIGRVNLCRNNRAIGIHLDGGFAEYAKLPAHRAHLLPAELNPHHGAFCEPLACTLHGLDLGAAKPGEKVMVLGGGVIGLLALQLACLAGADVMLVTRQQTKRDLALDLGATQTAASTAEARTLWPEGASLILECAGVAETVEAAPTLAARGGRVVILGVLPQGQKVSIEPFDLLFREVTLIHSFINPFTQSRAAAMIASGTINVGKLISRTIPLEDAAQAIANPARPGEVKVLVLP